MIALSAPSSNTDDSVLDGTGTLAAGVAGFRRNAAAAVARNGTLLGACEQERVVRHRAVGTRLSGFPTEALAAALLAADCDAAALSRYALAESGIDAPTGTEVWRSDHHRGHAATAALTSPFTEAAVLVCDSTNPGVGLWHFADGALRQEELGWQGQPPAALYAAASAEAGFHEGEEHKFEALARTGRCEALPAAAGTATDRAFLSSLARSLRQGAIQSRADAAATVSCAIGRLLLDVVQEVRRTVRSSNLCLGGGLFQNSYFNTLVAERGGFDRTFVPVHPGNSGLALGLAIDASRDNEYGSRGCGDLPFLGPAWDATEIKGILDNCKLSYAFASDSEVVDLAVQALNRGLLVGWYQGRMECGPRALGNRSILAAPDKPYVLENLNRFLKHRESYRSYSVSLCEEDTTRYFSGPASSQFMEYEYVPIEREPFNALLSGHASRLRVQTVGERPAMFRRLLQAYGDRTGLPVLVNTSLNGFNEPIACSPRDAIRVFYGTGLDMLVIGNFVLRK
jgi:carbamoyltransferase